MISFAELVRIAPKMPWPRLGTLAAIYVPVKHFNPSSDWSHLARLAVVMALLVLAPICADFLRQRLLR